MNQDFGAEIRPLILLPTYQERDNLDSVLDAIAAAQPKFHVLIVDDASPDGTGDLADRRSKLDPRIHVLHRPRKEGLGCAYIAAFKWAISASPAYTHFFEMDADLSHKPTQLEILFRACLDGNDLAVGSRYVSGGKIVGWSLMRRIVSRGGSIYARLVLGTQIQDMTSGFVGFRRAALEKLLQEEIQTKGFGFQIEVKFRCRKLGLQIRECPITFVDRTKGKSKMSASIFFEALALVWRLRISG